MTREMSILSYLLGVKICHLVNQQSAGLLWWELVRCCWSWYNTPWPRHQVCSLQRFLLTLSTSSGLIGFWRLFNGLLMLIHFVFTQSFYLWAIFGLSYNNSKNGLDSKKLICKIIPGIVGGCCWLRHLISGVQCCHPSNVVPTLALLS